MPLRFIDGALDWIDRIAPTSAPASSEQCRRSRAVVAAALLGCMVLSWTAVSTMALGLDRRLAVMNFAWSAAVLVVLALARWFSSPGLLANSLVAMGFSHTLILSAFSGGRNIGALFGFAVFPLVAVLLSGWRSGLVFTGLSAAAVLITPLIPVDMLAPSHLDGRVAPPALLRDALNVIFTVGLLSALYDFVRSSTLRDAEDARREAEESGRRARLAADRQRALLDLARRLHQMSPDDFDSQLESALEEAAGLASASRTVLRLVDGRDYAGRFSWGDDGELPRVDLGDVREARRSFRWVARAVLGGLSVQTRHPSELPEEAAAERAYLESRGVVSWLCIPIHAGPTPIGYQSFETTSAPKHWDDEEIAALRLMTQLLASAVLRNRSELALRESEKKFAVAFRDHPDAMVITDLETNEILECNDQWLREAGRTTREDVIGRRPWDFEFDVPEPQRNALTDALIERGRTPAIEISVRGRLGEQRTYLISATRIDIGGRACALANIHDLTSRKQLEQQLLHAQKMEAVGRLAGGIAHDFNNMLTVISGYSASLIADLDGELREDAEQIQQAARRSAELTRQLLAFSRTQVLQTQLLDPNDLIMGLEPMLRPLIGESIRLDVDLGSGIGLVRSDRGQLEQAIVNLVVNARDAMPDGGRLTLATDVHFRRTGDGAGTPLDLEPGRYVVISVEDDGAGMEPELAEHVMEPFFTTKPDGRGTGLGLPMVHGLARQCGGTLLLESSVGRGTVARVYLPVCDEDELELAPEPGGATPVAPSRTCRILVAEDEESVRRLTARTLRAAGYEVVEACSGHEALERANAMGEELDAILSDVVMPGLSGPELVRRLRDSRPTLPVLLMSGYADAARSRPVPDDVALITKPFSPTQLCEKVARLIGEDVKDDPETP
jgi:PAS domain S-box-containing protein